MLIIPPMRPTHRGLLRGFNLIEVMVALVIVAILATIGTNAYFSQIRKSRVTIAQQYLQDIAGVMERYYLDHKTFPSTLPISYQKVPVEITKDYAPPQLVIFDTVPASYRVFLNVLPTSNLLNSFNRNIPPHTLNLALDSDSHRWFETSNCSCTSGITYTSCNWGGSRVNSWEDFASSLGAVPSSGDSWTLHNKNLDYTVRSNNPIACKAY